jgi:hypothetical protein
VTRVVRMGVQGSTTKRSARRRVDRGRFASALVGPMYDTNNDRSFSSGGYTSRCYEGVSPSVGMDDLFESLLVRFPTLLAVDLDATEPWVGALWCAPSTAQAAVAVDRAINAAKGGALVALRLPGAISASWFAEVLSSAFEILCVVAPDRPVGVMVALFAPPDLAPMPDGAKVRSWDVASGPPETILSTLPVGSGADGGDCLAAAIQASDDRRRSEAILFASSLSRLQADVGPRRFSRWMKEKVARDRSDIVELKAAARILHLYPETFRRTDPGALRLLADLDDDHVGRVAIAVAAVNAPIGFRTLRNIVRSTKDPSNSPANSKERDRGKRCDEMLSPFGHSAAAWFDRRLDQLRSTLQKHADGAVAGFIRVPQSLRAKILGLRTALEFASDLGILSSGAVGVRSAHLAELDGAITPMRGVLGWFGIVRVAASRKGNA